MKKSMGMVEAMAAFLQAGLHFSSSQGNPGDRSRGRKNREGSNQLSPQLEKRRKRARAISNASRKINQKYAKAR